MGVFPTKGCNSAIFAMLHDNSEFCDIMKLKKRQTYTNPDFKLHSYHLSIHIYMHAYLDRYVCVVCVSLFVYQCIILNKVLRQCVSG